MISFYSIANVLYCSFVLFFWIDQSTEDGTLFIRKAEISSKSWEKRNDIDLPLCMCVRMSCFLLLLFDDDLSPVRGAMCDILLLSAVKKSIHLEKREKKTNWKAKQIDFLPVFSLFFFYTQKNERDEKKAKFRYHSRCDAR